MALILVVDDDAGMREWLTEIFQGVGHSVFAAQDGLEAKSLAMRQAVDVVISDVSMPNEDGLGLILAIRRAQPKLKIIVLSGNDPDALDDAILLGAHAAFRKPVTAQRILQCVSILLQSNSAEAVRTTLGA